MKLRRKYSFITGQKGFKEFIKYNVSEAERFVISCDKSPFFFDDEIEEYLGALEILEVNKKFHASLTAVEELAVKYFRYHSPNEKEPDNFQAIFEQIYLKWNKVLPKDKLKLSSFKLGKIMKQTRIKNHLSIIAMSIIMNVDRNTITKYENGERLPSLEYFYRFCVKFKLSMDRILTNN